MSLSVRIKYLDGLTGKNERYIKATFRKFKQKTGIATGRDSVYFGDTLEWPVGRVLEDRDTLILAAYNHRKNLPGSLLGTVKINVFSLVKEPFMSLRRNLIDGSNHASSMTLSFEVTYKSPDSRVGDMGYGLLQPIAPYDSVSEDFDDSRTPSQLEAGASMLDDNLDQLLEVERFIGEDDEDEEVDQDVFPAPEPRDPRLPALLGETIYKAEPFQLAINVIEARRLFGTNINPVITVTVGNSVQKTPAKFSTNRPFYDCYFAFDVQQAKTRFLSETISIRVFNIRQHPVLRLLPGKLIGEFVTDIRTVYDYKGHVFYNKWAVIVDPKDPWAGPRGFVRLDMGIIEQGQQMLRTKKEKTDEDENIESNLILPRYLHGQGQSTMVSLAIQIYSAEDLPPMHTDVSNQIRQAFVGEGAANVDPFVEVCYAGFSARTKVQRYNATPIWNQELIFNNYFPPLTHTIRINVRNAGLKGELIATHLIDLRSIMKFGAGGFLPVFGPSWVNLYGTPRIYTYAQMLRPEDELNMGLGEGVAYRGRLLMGITAKEDETIERVGTALGVASPVSETVAGKKSVYFLFVSFFDANLIDKKLGSRNKPISFEVSIGLFGNKLDGKRGGVDDTPMEFAKPTDGRERVEWNESITQPMMPRSNDKEYYFLDYGPRKPCVYMVCYFEDHRARMCVPNILERLYDFVDYGVKRVRFLLDSRNTRDARHYFRSLLQRLSKRINRVIQDVEGCRGTAMRTKLDIYYAKRICRDLKRMSVEAIRIATMKKSEMAERMRELNAIRNRIYEMTKDPQHALPDVFISMIQDGQRVGFLRIPARDIYYSPVDSEKGKWNGQLATLYIRKQGREGVGEKGWKIQCQLQVYLWLSLLKDYAEYKSGIPRGVALECFPPTKPPKELIFLPRSRFELRCYIFIARNLLASDPTGFSDPLARVLIKEHVLQTQPLIETMSPMWDVLLHKQVMFYHDAEAVKRNIQELVVEIFDIDPGLPDPENDLEFIGRCFCQMHVWVDGDQYKPPGLQWWPVYRGQTPAGELLAAFDLIQLDTKVPFDGIPTFAEIGAYTKEFDNRVILKSIPGMVLDDEDDLNRESTEDETEDDFEDDDLLLDVDTIVTGRTKAANRKSNSRAVKLGLAPPQLVINRREEDYRIPDSIRPPLKRFRVEVLFWSMYGMVKQQLLRVRRPKIIIEIGGTKIESEIMRDLTKKQLFEQQLKVADVYLPIDERYWPPMVMTCYDNRTFGTKVTVGTYTFSDIKEYLQLDDTESLDSEESLFEYGPQLGRRLNVGLQELLDLDADEVMPDLPVTPSNLSEQDVSGMYNLDEINPSVAPIGVQQLKEKSEAGEQDFEADEKEEGEIIGFAKPTTTSGPTQEQLNNADFWTRFYAAVQSSEAYVEEPAYNPLTDSDDSELSLKLEKIEIPMKQDEEEPAIVVEEKEDFWSKRKWWKGKGKKSKKNLTALQKRQLELENKRKKRVKKKKLREKVFAKFAGDAKKRYYQEQHDLVLNNGPEGEDLSWVQKVLIYPTALEELRDFNGFVSPLRSFPLYKGKQTEDEVSPEHRLAGFFKGNMLIYPVDDYAPMPKEESELRLYKSLPKRARVKLTVRVYIVRCIELHPADRNGKADPYLILSLGKVVIDEKADYQPKTLNPIFGKCYEFTAQLPADSLLVIQVMDHERFGSNELIGETRIDIESRFHSPHRATCGLMETYNAHGYAKWKDSLLPTEILERICEERGIEQPVYNLLENSVTIAGEVLYADTAIKNESGGTVKSVEPLALQVLQHFQVIEKDTRLVPEHVETRHLIHPDKPGLSQGKLQMWVDMFERQVAVPPPAIDISPRQPIKYELRVIIWNTADVILNDTSLFSSERSSDIYVKGWVKGVGIDEQKTDVHYRSLSGEGNFNWRFIFPFDYIKAEDRIVYPVKGPLDIEPGMVKANCELTLQIWDADLISSDNFLGTITMKLSSMPLCAKTPKSCGLHQLDPDCPKFSIFKNKNVRGWWPCAEEIHEVYELHGKVECEMSLLTAVDAENSPVGMAREEPGGLPKPNRPDSSFQKLLGPLNTIRYFLKYKLKWILIKVLIVFLVLLIVALFIYAFPGALVQKIVNG